MSDTAINTQEGFASVFEEYGKNIFRYIYVRVGNRRSLAEDLTQDVFERVWSNRDKYDSERASVKTWIFTIARNRLTDYYRKKREVPVDPETDVVDKSTVDHEENVEKKSLLYNSIRELSDKDRELITLRYIEEMDLEEIAEIMDMSYDATKVAAHRALKRLKGKINEEHD